jgi:hypothetical protein
MIKVLTILKFLQAFKSNFKLEWIEVRGGIIHNHHIGNIHKRHILNKDKDIKIQRDKESEGLGLHISSKVHTTQQLSNSSKSKIENSRAKFCFNILVLFSSLFSSTQHTNLSLKK